MDKYTNILILFLAIAISVIIAQLIGFSRMKWDLTDNELLTALKSGKKALVISLTAMLLLPLLGGGFSMLFSQKCRLFVVIFTFLSYLASTAVSGLLLRHLSIRREMSKRKKRNL
jgi:hypothetical protein